MMKLKPGARLNSAVSSVQVMVIKCSSGEGDLRCAGTSMLAIGEATPADAAAASGDVAVILLGKRYVDAAGHIELLCVKAGEGSLTLDGETLQTKEAKKLPSSD